MLTPKQQHTLIELLQREIDALVCHPHRAWAKKPVHEELERLRVIKDELYELDTERS